MTFLVGRSFLKPHHKKIGCECVFTRFIGPLVEGLILCPENDPRVIEGIKERDSDGRTFSLVVRLNFVPLSNQNRQNLEIHLT